MTQISFSRGIVDKGNRARVDLVDYANGLRDARNIITRPGGGATARPGFKFIAESRYPTKRVKPIPFVFSDDQSQTYLIEFGDFYAEFIQNGGRIVEASQAITAITQANPAVVTYVGADPANGDDFVITGGEMHQIAGRRLRVKNVNAGANTFEVTDLYNVNVNSAAYTAYVGGAVLNKIYKITTQYAEAHLQDLDYDQSADVLEIVHKSYYPQQLLRFGHTSWTRRFKMFEPDQARATALAVAVGAAGANTYYYKVTAVSPTGEESLEALRTPFAVSAVAKGGTTTITAVGHTFVNGELVWCDLFTGGMTELNKRAFVVANAGVNVFDLKIPSDGLTNVDSTDYTSYSAGGVFWRTSYTLLNSAVPTGGAPNVVTWTGAPGAAKYRIYRADAVNAAFGWIGETALTTFSDTGALLPDAGISPPLDPYPYDSPGKWPACVATYQQRLFYGGPSDTIRGSQTARYGNFTHCTPPTSADPIVSRLRAGQVNSLKRMVSLRKMLAFTSGQEWSLGSSGGALTPNTFEQSVSSYNGATNLKPIVAGGIVLYVQDRGTILQDTVFDWRVENFDGNDRSVRAQHLFDGHTIVDMAYQKTPHRCIWMPRDDGQMLGFTYMPKEEVFGFHRHDTDGVIENVCTIPESGEVALYLAIRRTISGQTRRYIERMATRLITDLADACFHDSSVPFDGTHTGATTLTWGAGTGWDYPAEIELFSSAPAFAATDVGTKEIHITGADGTVLRCTIMSFVNTSYVTVRPHMNVPVSMQAGPFATWAFAVHQITGLHHLEGKQVAMWADSGVVASRKTGLLTVTGGVVTLPGSEFRVKGMIGLPYFSDLETLDLNDVRNSKSGEQKLVTDVKIHLEDSMGGYIGGKPPTDDDVDPFENLDEIRYFDADTEGEIMTPLSEVIPQEIGDTWKKTGRVFVRSEGVPFTVLAITPEGIV